MFINTKPLKMPKEKWTKGLKFTKRTENGYDVYTPIGTHTDFKIVGVGDKRKVAPIDWKGGSVDELPDLDAEEYDKNKANLETYSNPKVDTKIMQGFNDYTDWLAKKGYAGKPEMNHVDYSNKAFQEYKKENPNTPLTERHFVPIQQEIHNYRDNLIQQYKDKKVQLDFKPKDDFSDLMSWAGTPLGSKNDGIIGQYSSQFRFPAAYLNEKTPVNRLGFVADVNMGEGDKSTPATPPMQTGQGVFYGGKRIAELFPNADKSVKLKFRNDISYTGDETDLKPEEVQKYLGTTNAIQTPALYNDLLSRGKTATTK